MTKKVVSYKGFKIQEQEHDSEDMIYVVYTKEEYAYGKGLRSSEWEACSMKEATDFIDCYNDGNEITQDNFFSYNDEIGFITLT